MSIGEHRRARRLHIALLHQTLTSCLAHFGGKPVKPGVQGRGGKQVHIPVTLYFKRHAAESSTGGLHWLFSVPSVGCVHFG